MSNLITDYPTDYNQHSLACQRFLYSGKIPYEAYTIRKRNADSSDYNRAFHGSQLGPNLSPNFASDLQDLTPVGTQVGTFTVKHPLFATMSVKLGCPDSVVR